MRFGQFCWIDAVVLGNSSKVEGEISKMPIVG